MRNRIWYILFFVAIGFQALAQVSFTAKANRYKVGKNENFTVEFKINDSGTGFRGPDFGGLRVASGPNQSSRSTIDNFGLRQTLSYSYVLNARKAGTYTIGSASIEVKGKTYKTKPITIQVTQNASPKEPNSPEALAAKYAFIKARVNKTEAYIGEPIITTFKVYYKYNISNYEEVEKPSFTGFYTEKLDNNGFRTSSERYGDDHYKTNILSQVLMIPQKSGKQDPGTYEIKLPTQVPTGKRDIFGRQMATVVNQISSASIPTLNIKALPSTGKPAGFNGAVGNFDMNVSVSRTELSANESVTLKIKLSGQGNIKLTDAPAPEIPTAFEAYDPKFSENIKVSGSGMSGNKTYEYLLIPRYNGKYKIPALSFSYFDPKKKEYKTITSEEFEIEVTGGSAQPGDISSGTPIASKENVSRIGNDILYIKTDASFSKKGTTFFKSFSFYGILSFLLFIPIGLILFAIVRKGTNADAAKAKQGKAGRVARKHLAEAKKKLDLNANDEFYIALSAAIWGYFSDKLSIPTSKMGKDIIEEELNSRDVDNGLVEKALDLMNRAELARFATGGSSEPSRDYEETVSVITEIEKQIG